MGLSSSVTQRGVGPPIQHPAHLPYLLHQALGCTAGVRGALHGRQQVWGRVADEEADSVRLATARDKAKQWSRHSLAAAQGHALTS